MWDGWTPLGDYCMYRGIWRVSKAYPGPIYTVWRLKKAPSSRYTWEARLYTRDPQEAISVCG